MYFCYYQRTYIGSSDTTRPIIAHPILLRVRRLRLYQQLWPARIRRISRDQVAAIFRTAPLLPAPPGKPRCRRQSPLPLSSPWALDLAMADRYRVYPSAGAARPAAMNPARTSLPSGVGYSSSMYTGEMAPTTSRHYVAAPRAYLGPGSSSAAPSRAYPVASDPRSRPNPHETSRSRRSTMESASRPPVIITTTQVDRQQAPSSHSSTTRSGSPVKNDYRSSDGQFYTQPASSLRSRSTTRPYHPSSGSDDFGRFRERGDALLSPREVDAYRSTRPSVVYSNDSRHPVAAIDYGDEGYQYTNAGELARYDLDHPRPTSRPRRHDSLDRGNYRPHINYSPDQRGFHPNTSHDLGRNFGIAASRPYERGGGPPPSTRGFDKIKRGYETHRDAPGPSSSTVSSQADATLASAERREPARRTRPLSLHQDSTPWTSHHDDYYRSREDDRILRDPLDRTRDMDRDIERPGEPARFKDDSVTARGFGIRTDVAEGSKEVWERRRDPRPDDSRKRPDEVLVEPRRERRESKREDEGEGKERSRFRDKMAAGLGVAATAVGLAPPTKSDKKEAESKDSRRRRSPDDASPHYKDDERTEWASVDKPLRREREWERDRALDDSRMDMQALEYQNPETLPSVASEAVASASDSDDSKYVPSRSQASNLFNPNDTSDLKQLKKQLAAMDGPDKSDQNDGEKQSTYLERRSCSLSSTEESRDCVSSREESRGRELMVPASEPRQVRVVSPPREKADDRPLKGILKQPSARFPEDNNSAREGVAPHKEDKKIKEAPEGARWTKINRKIVNPEALTIGKERFEVRDDFVIVLRVLSKEEIQAYAAATQVLREKRRSKVDEGRDRDRERDRGRGQDDDDDGDREQDSERGRHHHYRQHRRRDDEDQGSSEHDHDIDRERRRRFRREDEDDHGSRSGEAEHHYPRSYRGRERAAEV
ncbi:hypothetical protein CDD81_3054 [Ophiocordyceps australis]|uniref:DUF8035 domain-containing protein n=1 Tax=Ophiocordyceps australis TaxID=1399860 RepID=A0A2C5Y6T7_9HYPO|nr:hypothetical protein CDD81_3054 [Ophiocordyceps australis]